MDRRRGLDSARVRQRRTTLRRIRKDPTGERRSQITARADHLPAWAARAPAVKTEERNRGSFLEPLCLWVSTAALLAPSLTRAEGQPAAGASRGHATRPPATAARAAATNCRDLGGPRSPFWKQEVRGQGASTGGSLSLRLRHSSSNLTVSPEGPAPNSIPPGGGVNV